MPSPRRTSGAGPRSDCRPRPLRPRAASLGEATRVDDERGRAGPLPPASSPRRGPPASTTSGAQTRSTSRAWSLAAALALPLACLGALACDGRRRPPEPPLVDPGEDPEGRDEPLPPVAERPTCRELWADSGAGDYDYKRDAEAGARGNHGYVDYAARAKRRRCRKTWTVLIYMAADNHDLPLHALWNIDDIETAPAAASTVDHDVVVHLDLEGPGGLRRLHLFGDPQASPATDAARFAAADPSAIRSPIVAFDRDEDRPAAALLEEFVRWGVDQYPADHVAVILWGHGQGWRGRPEAGASARPIRYEEREGGLVGGIAFDHTQGAVIDIPSLADALAQAGAELRTAPDDPPFDLVLADACLMQTASVTAGLSGLADYLGGYEPIAPYPGLPYRSLLPELDRGPAEPPPGCRPGDRACDFAARIPGAYSRAVAAGHYDLRADYSPPVAETYAISIVAAAPLRERLLPGLDDLGDALLAWLAEAPIRAVELQDLLGTRGLPGFLGGTRDLGLVVAGLRDAARREIARDGAASPATAALAEQLEALAADLDATVLARASGTRYAIGPRPEGLAGLAVWLPRTADELARRLPDYASAPTFADAEGSATAWQRWISATFAPPG